jgi:dienelactone hydrolase
MNRLVSGILVLLACGVHAVAAPPQTLTELWAGFDPHREPIEAEVLKSWEQEGVACHVVRYQVGVFKGAPSRVAGFYAFPVGGQRLPAVIHIHGGGQSASLDVVTRYAKLGYACLSLNWGGNAMRLKDGDWDGPQTDWGRLDATHPPQRVKVNHFAGPLTPDEFTLDDVESARNSAWFVVLMAARRAVTFLESRPEVDAARIGACGHSMGGKLTTNLAGIEPRIKAAVPSCGGKGELLEGPDVVPGGTRRAVTPVELACISDNAYIPRITCPILWLSPTNDFNADIDNMAWNWRNLPDEQTRFSIAPHLNHAHTAAHAITEVMWFEQHLKGVSFRMPTTPRLVVEVDPATGIPRATVTPDAALPVAKVDIYYSSDPQALTRFWRDAGATRQGERWTASCPMMRVDDPLFVYANVSYPLPDGFALAWRPSAADPDRVFAISSRVQGLPAAKLSGVKPTDTVDRMIDDGSRGWHDWFRASWDHPPLWKATTRKLKDPKWRGPNAATLAFEIRCEADNQLVLTFRSNGWGAFMPGKPPVDYVVRRPLKGAPDWQSVTVDLADVAPLEAGAPPLADWRTITEFSISPSGPVGGKDGPKNPDGRPWRGPREIRNLRWEGGTYPPDSAGKASTTAADVDRNFNAAIKESLEQEKRDAARQPRP